MRTFSNSDTILRQAAQRVACRDLFDRCSLIVAAMRCDEHAQPPSLIIKDDTVEIQACCPHFREQVEMEITLKTGNKPIQMKEFQAAKNPPSASAGA